MKNVIILGASGNIARQVIDILSGKDHVNLTLFLRNAKRLKKDVPNARNIEGDVLKYDQLKDAIRGQDIVYVNLAGDLEAINFQIVESPEKTWVLINRIHSLFQNGQIVLCCSGILRPDHNATR